MSTKQKKKARKYSINIPLISVFVTIGMGILGLSLEIYFRSRDTPRIKIITSSKYDQGDDIYYYHFRFENNGHVDVENLHFAIASEDVLPLTNCSLDFPFDTITPRLGQNMTGNYYIFEIPVLTPTEFITGNCSSEGYGITFTDKYGLSPEKVRCKDSSFSLLVPHLQYYGGKNLEEKNIKYHCKKQ